MKAGHPKGGGALVDLLLAVAAFVTGYALCDHYVRRFGADGFGFLDDGLIAAPAVQMAAGLVPFRDFATIQGLTAAMSEAIFVALLGPGILAAIVHVSVVNGLAAVLSFHALRLLDAPRIAAASFALLTAVAFYPPQGQAFGVQHGALAMLVALCAALIAARRAMSEPVRLACWAAVGICFAFAYLGKPTLGLMAPAVLLALAADLRGRGAAAIAARFALGAAGGVLPFLALYLWAGADAAALERMWTFLVELPWGFAAGRLDLYSILVVYQLATAPVIILSAAGVLAGLYLARVLPRVPGNPGGTAIGPLHALLVGGLLLWGNVYLARVHIRWEYNTLLQMVFVGSGLVATGLYRLFAGQGGIEAAVGRALMALFLCVSALDAWWLNSNMNARRGMRYERTSLSYPSQAPPSAIYPELRGLSFYDTRIVMRSDAVGTGLDLTRVLEVDAGQIAALRALSYNVLSSGIPRHVLLFAGKVPALPVVSVQPGASSPYRDMPAFARLLEDLRRNVERLGVGAVVFGEAAHARHRETVEARRDIFCAVREEPSAHLVIAELCPPKALPADLAPVLAHVIGLDGPLYK